MSPTVRALLVIATLIFVGCSNQGRGCALVETIVPVVQVAYPVPSASGVPTQPSLVLYYTYGASPAPLVLVSAAESIDGTPAVVPSPLPSPIALASPNPGAELSAASFPQLRGATAYDVRYDQTTAGACSPSSTARVTAASFTTR